MHSICVLMLLFAAQLSSAQESQNVPRDVLAAWSYTIGDWDVEGRVGSTPVKGSATFEWADGRHCYTGRQKWTIGESSRAVYLTLIGGWNDAAQETVEQGFDSSGSAATVHYRVAPEKGGTIEGTIDGSEKGGARWLGEIRVDRKGPDEFQMTTRVDGEIVHSLKYVRAKGEPPASRLRAAAAAPRVSNWHSPGSSSFFPAKPRLRRSPPNKGNTCRDNAGK
jgi:hypothetical protein